MLASQSSNPSWVATAAAAACAETISEARCNGQTHKFSQVHTVLCGGANPLRLDLVDVALQLRARDVLAVLLDQLFHVPAAHLVFDACAHACMSTSCHDSSAFLVRQI